MSLRPTLVSRNDKVLDYLVRYFTIGKLRGPKQELS
jgi:hypothetical protein